MGVHILPPHIGDDSYIPSSGLPIWGYGPEGINTEAEISTYLTTTMADQNGGEIALTPGAEDYVYFASPKSLGHVTFMDKASGFPQGWDGALWPDGAYSSELVGPMTIYINGEQWYLYRTDYKGNEASVVITSFDDPVGPPAVIPTSVVMDAPPTAVSENGSGSMGTATVTFSDTTSSVQDGIWSSDNEAVLSFADSSLPNFTTGEVVGSANVTVMFSYTSEGETVTVTADILVSDAPIVPVSSQILGPVTLEEGASYTYQLEVTYDDASTQIVAASWSTSSGDMTIDAVTGEATAGSVTVETVARITATKTIDAVNLDTFIDVTIPDTPVLSRLPRYGVAPLFGYGVATEADLDALANEGTLEDFRFTVNATGSNYIYYAEPVTQGAAFFTSFPDNQTGGMDGAKWAHDFDYEVFGPLVVSYRGEDWNVYRSDFIAPGSMTFDVSHL